MIVAKGKEGIAMYELIKVKKNEIFTTSKIIAEGTNNKHHSITAVIQKYENDFSDSGKVRFKMEPLPSGQKEKVYLLNEEQATLLITYLRNNEVVRKFKKNLVHQFYQMRRFLIKKQSGIWMETRENSKANRLKETDVIKMLAEYAEKQGSTHPDKLYIVYTKLANTVIDCKRDNADVMQLNNMTLVENIILQTIRIDMSMGMHYKDIYKDCKQKVEQFMQLTYLNQKEQLPA